MGRPFFVNRCMGNILLRNIKLDGLTKDISITGRLISGIAPAFTVLPQAGTEVMDCSGKTAVPGFINMHTHSPMTLLRGIGEDVSFHDWLDKIWTIEAGIDHEFIYWGSKLAALEMIKSGTTTFNDQYWSFPETLRASKEMGIRAATGYDIMDMGDPDTAAFQKEQCMERYESFKPTDESSIFTMSFHAVYSVSEEMMLWASNFAKERNLPLHIHLCETLKEVEDCKQAHGGLTPVEYLDALGILDSRVIAAHTLWLSPNDVRILGERKVNCVHNINSNLKLSSGYRFLYNELKEAGANICIGTDGPASSNNLDMLEAMKTSALVQKAWRNDPKAMPLGELFAMSTLNGAKALHLNSGSIETGKLADINIVSTDSVHFISPGSFLANLVYSAHSDCIDSVIAGGEFVMKNRKVRAEEEILEGAGNYLSRHNLTH